MLHIDPYLSFHSHILDILIHFPLVTLCGSLDHYRYWLGDGLLPDSIRPLPRLLCDKSPGGTLAAILFYEFDIIALSWWWFAITRALPGLAGSSLERFQRISKDQLLPTFPRTNGLIIITSQTSNPITVHRCHVIVIMLMNEAMTQNQTIA